MLQKYNLVTELHKYTAVQAMWHEHSSTLPSQDPDILIAEQQCACPDAMRHNDLADASVVSAWCLAYVWNGWRNFSTVVKVGEDTLNYSGPFLAARSLTQHLCLAVTQPFTWCCQQKEKKDIFNFSLEWCHWGYCSWNSHHFPLQPKTSDDSVLCL